MATTIKHLPDGEIRVTGIVAFALMTPNELDYLVGALPPRYPVPAIPLDVSIYPACVCIYPKDEWQPIKTWWAPHRAKEMEGQL